MKLSLILEAIDRISGPARKAADSVGKLGDRARAATGPARRAAEAVDKMGKSSQTAERQVTRVSAATFKWTRLALRSADAMDRATASAARFAGRAGLKAVEMAGHGVARGVGFAARKVMDLARATARWGTIGAVAGASWLIGGTIALASQFEQFQVVLENTEGSAEKARRAMAWVKDFAKTTPYEVTDVMEAFVALKAYGIDPMNGSLRALGDAASGMNKPLMQAVEMLADAQTGEFERLKEFGVRAKVAGDRVTFTYMKAGREITATARNSATEINRTLLDVFGARFSGMMDRQSRTLAGLWSNIKDQVANFQLDIANAGLFDMVKAKVQAVLDWINAKAKDGSLKRWAQNISDALQKAVAWAEKFIGETDWKAVGDDLQLIAKGAWGIATALGRMVQYAEKLQALSNVAGLFSPMGAFRGAMAGGAMVGDWFASKPAPKPVMPALRKPSAADWMGAARSLNAPARPGFAPPLNRPAAPRPPLAAPKGSLEVTIKTPPGVQARPTKVAASDMDLSVNTGKAMGGWA